MKKVIAAVGLALASTGTLAADLDQLDSLGQQTFRLLSEDLGAALSYKALAPAEPLGLLGFDIGLEMTATTLQNTDAFNGATSSSTDINVLPMPKIHLHKGLPGKIDIGASYTAVPDSNIKLVGAELRWAFIGGGIAIPAVAVRGTYSKLDGVDQLDFSTTGLELTVSKGFAMLTPYAGVGQVWVTSTPKNVGNLTAEEFTQSKVYLGANLNLGLMNLAFEGDKTGNATSYGAKFGFRF